MSTVLQADEVALAESDFHAFNRALWHRLADNPILAGLDYRIETDKHGQIIMSPPSAPSHGNFQATFSYLLRKLMGGGKVLSECPVSTSEGVKAADVAWSSDVIWASLDGSLCFERCPEICVEVLSPSNTRSEISEKRRLYFEGGAKEFWSCDLNGKITFFDSADGTGIETSRLCPNFPEAIEG